MPSRDTRRRTIRAATLVGLVLALVGCFSTGHRAGPRDASVAPMPLDAWPTRDEAPARRLMEQTPETLPRYALVPGVSIESLSHEAREEAAKPRAIITHQAIRAGGLFRTYAEPSMTDMDPDGIGAKIDAMLGSFHANAEYVSSRTTENPRLSDRLAESRESTNRRRSHNKAQGFYVTNADDEALLGEGIRMMIPSKREKPQRGLVLHFAALLTNEYETKVMDEFRRRGWSVLTIETATSLHAPRYPDALAKLPALKERKATLSERLTPWPKQISEAEKKKVEADFAEVLLEIWRIERGWFEACDATSADQAGRDIAWAVDDALTENALAAQAALEYCRERRPDLVQGPLVIIGFSAGALAAPSVAARLQALGTPPAAVVLVAGGANLLEISLDTALKGERVRVFCGDKPLDPQLRPAITSAYLAATRLDPEKTAPQLRATPVLQVHSTSDTIVPSRTGQRLFELLGRPDRIDFSRDHTTLFYFMPDIRGRIADWVEKHTKTQP